MGLFNRLFKSQPESTLDVADDVIVAPADGELIDVTTVSDPMFAQQLMGPSIAFTYPGDKVTITAPANGTITVLFPTGHAFGLTMKNGVEILIHIGIDTVSSNGDGFKILKKQGETVKAGTPIVEVDLAKLKQKYDMPTMLIITNPNSQDIHFKAPGTVKLGDPVLM